jgi:serine/threonine-protein kinase
MAYTLYETIIKAEPITKGWSEDKKYCVTTADDTKYLLRISPASRFEARKALFAMLEKAAELNIPMCIPIEFGFCEDNPMFLGGVYTLQSWIDGEDLEEVLPCLSETGQYALGLKSGEIIRKMHTIPAPETQEEWAVRFNRKTSYKIQKYQECGVRFEGDDKVITYIEENRHLLENRPQCFQHGDYHVGNMMLENGELRIIDFDRYDFGDPWEEFNRIVWSAAVSPHFATGQLRGYFGGEPPIEFFKLLAFYIASNTLSSIYWAIPFGQSDLNTMMKQSQNVLAWYEGMQNPIPTWYLKDFYIQWVDGVPYKLKSPFDFSFLSKYGKVFKAFDDQDSGNICFGVQANDGKRYFVKFAGAPTARAGVGVDEAIQNLKSAVPVYRDLAHPKLIRLVGDEDINHGYAVVFDWADAECMGRMYPVSRIKFMALALDTRVKIYEEILAFHAYVVACGYVAIDFYDGSIMYDFGSEETIICDIDFYAKSPYVNRMGRLWGSGRFMSPEEFTLDAAIDEVTNVYAMGATAFALFSEYDRSPKAWPLSSGLYEVVKQSVSNERSKRQQSIRQLIDEWRAAR